MFNEKKVLLVLMQISL